jgi:hypothetical protein
MDWDLDLITPLHYVNLMLAQGVVFEDDLIIVPKRRQQSKANGAYSPKVSLVEGNQTKKIDLKSLRCICKYTEFFADLSLESKY